jgi:hypothetical protein
VNRLLRIARTLCVPLYETPLNHANCDA